jgi:hypothetical protein
MSWRRARWTKWATPSANRPARSASIASATLWICAGGRTLNIPSRSRPTPSSCCAPAGLTGAATKNGRSCSASMARPGTTKPSWMSTCKLLEEAKAARSPAAGQAVGSVPHFAAGRLWPAAVAAQGRGAARTLEGFPAPAPSWSAATCRSSRRTSASWTCTSPAAIIPYYKDSQYTPIDVDEEKFMLKPMNCPHHIEIYKQRAAQLPRFALRLAEFGTVYRYEQSGELNGLTRVRGFTVDDSHLFVTPDQLGRGVHRRGGFDPARVSARWASTISARGWAPMIPTATNTPVRRRCGRGASPPSSQAADKVGHELHD